jgi:hypothetical protein
MWQVDHRHDSGTVHGAVHKSGFFLGKIHENTLCTVHNSRFIFFVDFFLQKMKLSFFGGKFQIMNSVFLMNFPDFSGRWFFQKMNFSEFLEFSRYEQCVTVYF